jgi:esterase/lipase superfamily enzyme
MLKTIGILARYGVSMTVLAVVGLGLRYAGSWSPTTPTDPTREAISLKPSEPLPSPVVVRRDHEETVWEIAYATDRVGDDLSYGTIHVAIPRFRARGSLDLASDEELSDAPIRLQTPADCDVGEFYKHLARQLDDAETLGVGRDLLVFVHGYNVSFDSAVARVAQMAEDMPFSGVVLAFDWNSQAEILGYYADSRMVGPAARRLADVLANLHARLGDDARIHVLAHSMGNRVTLRALASLEMQRTVISDRGFDVTKADITLLKPQYPDWKPAGLKPRERPPLCHLVFAAPDVDPEEFRDTLAAISGAAKQMTLYSSDSDFALEMSRYANLHDQHTFRSGDSRSRLRAGCLQTIHVTGVNRGDPFGHAYYASHPGLLTDLSALLLHDTPPAKRPTVTADGGGNTWRLR